MEKQHLDQEAPLHIVLVEPRIPPNTGNVARLCASTGCCLHLVEPLGFSLESRFLKRAGLDYWDSVSVQCWPDFNALRSAFIHGRFHFFSSRVNRLYTQVNFQSGDFLVFGSETTGLPDPLILANLEQAYTIPMWGRVRSLNLSTSVGIVAYEALRQIKHF